MNPLSPDHTEPVGLSNVAVAPLDVFNDLLEAHSIGEDIYQHFRTIRVKTNL